MDKQIMIDGVNVSGCELYRNDNGVFAPDGTAERTELCYLTNDYCANNPNCYYKQLTRKKQECEELRRKLSNQEQLYQNEIEIYNNSCLQLRQENDDLYLERLALNTANSGINALLEVKEQECDRYRKALEEIENYICEYEMLGKLNIKYILNIISKAKGR